MTRDDEAGGWSAAQAAGIAEQTEFFERAGLSADAAAALVDIDQTLQRVRQSLARRDLLAKILKALDPGMELGHLDTLAASLRRNEAPKGEVTVGFVADALGVDPSRASRLVADVVDRGYLRRVASQADSRRICLVPTERGEAFARAFHRDKWRLMAEAMADWSTDDIVVFARLLARYATCALAVNARELSGRRDEAPSAEPSSEA